MLMARIVKTIHQLNEGFKALSDKLHHSKNEHETSTLAVPVPLKDVLVKAASISESPDHANQADRAISQLEKWSDDGLPQQTVLQSVAGMASSLTGRIKLLNCRSRSDTKFRPSANPIGGQSFRHTAIDDCVREQAILDRPQPRNQWHLLF